MNNTNYHYYKKKVGHSINTFTINNNTYSIRLSNHAQQRLTQRNLDLYQVTGSILSLGQQQIEYYAGSNRDIFIKDSQNNFSVVCNIVKNTITIVTVIDNADCWIKSGTIAVNL